MVGLTFDPAKPTVADFERTMRRAGVRQVRFFHGRAGWFGTCVLEPCYVRPNMPPAMVSGCHPTLAEVMLELMGWAAQRADAREGA
jgi:hypothetical protein